MVCPDGDLGPGLVRFLGVPWNVVSLGACVWD